jgi:hypothetical protein
MYFPKHRVTLNIAETSYVLNSIHGLMTQNEDENYKISNEYHDGLLILFNDCENLWNEDEWEAYKYMTTFNNFNRKWEVDRKAEWQINILDCDSIIFTFQYAFMRASKDFINGDNNAQEVIKVMSQILIPRFTNSFSDNEWQYYFSLSDEDIIEEEVNAFDLFNQDTQEIV